MADGARSHQLLRTCAPFRAGARARRRMGPDTLTALAVAAASVFSASHLGVFPKAAPARGGHKPSTH